jgi:hypothetical protein
LNVAPPEPPKVEQKPVKKLGNSVLLNSGPSPIEQFNAEHEIADLLRSYGATETHDGWACNCGQQHSHETQLAVTSQGKLVSYSTSCDWAPHYKSGKCQDAFGLYCLVEHSGRVKDAVAALLPPKEEKPSGPTRAQIEARRQAAADLRADALARAAVDEGMPRQAHRLLDIHLTIAGQRGWHRASVARMAELAGFGERWVQRFNEYLIDKGYVTREQPNPSNTAIWTFVKSDSQGTETQQTADERVIAPDMASQIDRSPVLDLERDLTPLPVGACEHPQRQAPETLDEWEACEDCHGADKLNALDLVPEPPALTQQQVDTAPRWGGLSPREQHTLRRMAAGDVLRMERVPDAEPEGEQVAFVEPAPAPQPDPSTPLGWAQLRWQRKQGRQHRLVRRTGPPVEVRPGVTTFFQGKSPLRTNELF